MLDLNHPMTKHRFAAAAVGDRLLGLAKYMTLTSTEQRYELWAQCQEPLDRLRRLNDAHFGASEFIAAAIGELARALDNLAQMSTNPPTGTAYAIVSCPACGSHLVHHHAAYMPEPEQRWSVYCSPCLDGIGPARQKLDWMDGFGTWAI